VTDPNRWSAPAHDPGAASFTGNIPDHYDRDLGPYIFADYAADMARRTAASRPMRVLEIAAGTGIVTRELRDQLPAGAHLTATDLNPPMIDVARAKFRAGEQVTFQPADALDLPFPDGTFDAVVCQFGVMFYPDKAKSYREARRVLAPGGRYHFSVWDSHRHNAFSRITHETVTRLFPDDPPQFYQVPFGYHLIDPIKESLIEAGFRKIDASVVALDTYVADVAQLAQGLIFGNPLIEQIRAREGIDAELVRDALVEALRVEFGAGAATMQTQSIVFEAS
jgi:ubiquinone/menaquinone biosynthesis C-methylase UbiE